MCYRRSTDGGATWAAQATLHTASGTNTLSSILTAADGIIAVEERQTAGTALLQTYAWTGAAWALVDTYDTGATQLWGGGIDTEGGTFAVFAGDFLQPSTAGTVTLTPPAGLFEELPDDEPEPDDGEPETAASGDED